MSDNELDYEPDPSRDFGVKSLIEDEGNNLEVFVNYHKNTNWTILESLCLSFDIFEEDVLKAS